MARARNGLALAFFLAAAPASAQTVEVRDVTGRATAEVLPGERFIVRGEAPEPVRLRVQQGSRVAIEREAPPGRYRFRVRLRRPGVASITASGATDVAATAVEVLRAGRPRRGCDGQAIVLRSMAATVAGRAVRRGVLLSPGAVVTTRGTVVLRRPAGEPHLTRSLPHRLPHGGGPGPPPSGEYRAGPGKVEVECSAVERRDGVLRIDGRGAVLTDGALAEVRDGRLVAADGEVRYRGEGRVTAQGDPAHPLRTVAGDRALVDGDGVRLETWPFARAPEERVARGPAPFWADGQACSTGCRPRGVRAGWPVKPFRAQHPLRAGLNELRPGNLHTGVDVQALDGTPVYALQGGQAEVEGRGTFDERVLVGRYEYWHLQARVRDGARVRARRTVLGRIREGANHVHLSERLGGRYVNPLRPGGRRLEPWRDTEPPVVGAVTRGAGGLVVEAFDPQSVRATIRNRTPVLAPAAVAWRAGGGALHFAYRGSQHHPSAARDLLYGPGTRRPDAPGVRPGGDCFGHARVCVPRWEYRLLGAPAAGPVTVYAWDWAGNASVLTTTP